MRSQTDWFLRCASSARSLRSSSLSALLRRYFSSKVRRRSSTSLVVSSSRSPRMREISSRRFLKASIRLFTLSSFSCSFSFTRLSLDRLARDDLHFLPFEVHCSLMLKHHFSLITLELASPIKPRIGPSFSNQCILWKFEQKLSYEFTPTLLHDFTVVLHSLF